ncbi:hypothetical protein [Niastella sp. OAS944]|uniref:hypothetical protein n=1 Tax=Niastella sp. OAS944 TaxID=2664089 RepID=UPI0034830CD1|nr:hypothetical protein [Chitinophagaceae bacterium OAS944]
MNERLKEITVNGASYSFHFEKEANTWLVLENISLIGTYDVDLKIEVEHTGEAINWNEITGFIDFITGSSKQVNEQLDDAKFVLETFFKATHKKYYSDAFLKDVIFEPSGITYKGCYKAGDQKNVFGYSFLYFPYYAHWGEDLGSSSWEVNFRGDQLLNVQYNLQ